MKLEAFISDAHLHEIRTGGRLKIEATVTLVGRRPHGPLDEETFAELRIDVIDHLRKDEA